MLNIFCVACCSNICPGTFSNAELVKTKKPKQVSMILGLLGFFKVFFSFLGFRPNVRTVARGTPVPCTQEYHQEEIYTRRLTSALLC